MKRKIETKSGEKGENVKKLKLLFSMDENRKVLRNRILDSFSIHILLRLYNYFARKESRRSITKNKAYRKYRGVLYRIGDRALKNDLSDLDYDFFIPTREPKEIPTRIFLINQINSLPDGVSINLINRYWELGRGGNVPKTAKERATWLYSAMYNRVPDEEKRKIENQNLENFDLNDMRFFHWGDHTIPWDVMWEIFNFFPKDKSTLDLFGTINEKHYMFALMNWNRVTLRSKCLYKIPRIALFNASEISSFISSNPSLSTTDKQYVIDAFQRKRVRVLKVNGLGGMKLIKENKFENIVDLQIGSKKYSRFSYPLTVSEIFNNIPNLNTLRVFIGRVFSRDIFYTIPNDRGLLKNLKKLYIVGGPFGMNRDYFRSMNLNVFSFRISPGVNSYQLRVFLDNATFEKLSRMKLNELEIPFDGRVNSIADMLKYFECQKEITHFTVRITNITSTHSSSLEWAISIIGSLNIRRINIEYDCVLTPQNNFYFFGNQRKDLNIPKRDMMFLDQVCVAKLEKINLAFSPPLSS